MQHVSKLAVTGSQGVHRGRGVVQGVQHRGRKQSRVCTGTERYIVHRNREQVAGCGW